MISVVLCCRNERHSIEPAVAAVERQIKDVAEPVEIIIACNRSTDGTEDLVRTFQHPSILLDRNYHSGVLHNVALQECRGDLVFFLDGDMLLGAGSLAALRPVFADPEVVGLCGYKWADIRQLHRIDQIRDLIYQAKSGKAKLRRRALVSLDRTYTMTGGLFAVRVAALRAIGGYDPSFRRYACEDLYVEIRLLNEGYKLSYEPAVTAYHLHRHASVREFFWRAYAGMPRGLAHLVQRCAERGIRLPFDGHVMHVPIHTTGVFLLGIAAASAGWRYGAFALVIGSVVQFVDVLPFLTTRRGEYPLRTRIATAGFWFIVNVCRLAFCAFLWLRRLAPGPAPELVAGMIERPHAPPVRFERRLEHPLPTCGPVQFRLRLAQVLVGLWWSMARRGWREAKSRLRAGSGHSPVPLPSDHVRPR